MRVGSTQHALKVLEVTLKMIETQHLATSNFDRVKGLEPYVDLVFFDTLIKRRDRGNPKELVRFQYDNGNWKKIGASFPGREFVPIPPQTTHPLTYAKRMLSTKPTLVLQDIKIYTKITRPGREIAGIAIHMFHLRTHNPDSTIIHNNTRARALQTLKWPMREHMAKRLYRPDGPRVKAMMNEAMANVGGAGTKRRRANVNRKPAQSGPTYGWLLSKRRRA